METKNDLEMSTSSRPSNIKQNSELEALNLVHEWAELASRLWVEDGDPTTTPVQQIRAPYQRLSEDNCISQASIRSSVSPVKKIVPRRLSLESGNIASTPTSRRIPIKNEKKRIQPMSIPLMPPDIQNMQMFPPISSSTNSPNDSPTCGSENRNNPFLTASEATLNTSTADIRVQKLEEKMRRVAVTPANIPQSPELLRIPEEQMKNKQEKSVRVPRSSELLAELSPDKLKELDRLSLEYSNCLNNNLCRSVLTEITFLFQLLTSNSNINSGNLIFSTVAARVYFVIKVVHHQIVLLIPQLDPQICHVLLQNLPHRLPKPLRRLIEKVIHGQQESKRMSEMVLGGSFPSNTFNCVTFQTDTDGKANFPNQSDFHAFCKQRDMFYAIKDIWETNRIQNSTVTSSTPVKSHNSHPTFGKQDAASSKMRALFQLNSSSINMAHLASLFLSQFLLDSLESKQNGVRAVIQDENVRQLFESNPSRFQQLQNRFSDPPSSSNYPSGNSILAFPKYFISLAASPEFNQHLIDRVILEINKIETSIDKEEINDPKEITDCLKKSLLLARILGYLCFLPYQNQGPHAARYRKPGISTIEKESSVAKQIELRSHQNPPIELASKLVKSYSNKRLMITLPWIIEFLVQADHVTFFLPNYKSIILLIVFFYRNYLTCTNDSTLIASANKNFLRFYCGILFSLEDFPDSLLFNEKLENHFPEYYAEILSVNEMSKRNKRTNVAKSTKSDEDELIIDSLNYLGEILIKICFVQQMNQIKSILSTASGVQSELRPDSSNSSGGIVKHIRPIPATSNNSVLSKSSEIQILLESSFFHGHPTSVKKTVDFVAERVASIFVKNVRTDIYPTERNELLSKGIFKEDAAKACRSNILNIFGEFSNSKCEESVNILIGDSINTGALSICREIAYRRCAEKVIDWVKAHINGDMFPVVPKPTYSGEEPSKKAEPKTTSFQAMITIHRCLQKIHKKHPVDPDLIDRVLDEDLLGETPYVTSVTIDICLAMCAFTPTLLTIERLTKFVCFWKKIWTDSCKILCPRNLVLLSQSEDSKLTWEKICLLMKIMLKNDLLTTETLQEQCVSLLRQDWPHELHLHISQFLKSVLGSLESNSRSMDTEVIDWIAWYCSSAPDESM